ncbi:MAG: ADP-ribosylation factor-like protein [Candidatus Heimdallarchaeaceae archaeon]
MSGNILKKKGIPVTLIGLNNAGKTSLALRLIKGTWVDDTVPTIGVNFEMYRVGDTLLKIFDIGGHELFRRQFWLNYASVSYGVLFIFDAADRSRIEEGKKWFWYFIENLRVEKRIVVAFFANKADLDSMSIEEIVQALDLQKMSQYPEISFQIFKVSVKTNENLQEAIKWFTRKINDIIEDLVIHPKGLIISSSLGKIKLFLDFSDVSRNLPSVIDILPQMLEKENISLEEERIARIYSDYGQIVFQERGEAVISLITDKNDSYVEAQRILELIFEHLEKQQFRTKDELIHFILNTLNVPRSNCREIT